MNVSLLADEIFDTLQEFDRLVAPFGLYSVRDVLLEPKPKEILQPFKEQVEARDEWKNIEDFCHSLSHVEKWAKLNTPRFSLVIPDIGYTSLNGANFKNQSPAIRLEIPR